MCVNLLILCVPSNKNSKYLVKTCSFMNNFYALWRSIFIYVFLFFSLTTFAQVGIGTTNPNGNALLELDASTTPGGLLLPRVALVATDDVAPLSAHIPGMAVYNTATTPGANGVSEGYYFNDGSGWVRIAASSDASDDWKLTGNAGTVPGTNFIGTTDNQPLSFSTNGTEKFRIPNAEQVHAMGNGTAAAPFYSWSSDSDIGMYRIGNNTLGLSTNGNERFRILEDGRVIVNNTAAFSSYFNSFASGTSMAIAARSINGDAIYADTQGNGDAIVGIATGSGMGVVGLSQSSIGVYAASASSNQMAIISAGNNVGAVDGGSIGLGNSFSGSSYGGGGFGRSSASTGFIGIGNAGLLTVDHPDGSGLAGTGNRIGIYGHALYGGVGSSNNGNAGGVFSLGTDEDDTFSRAYAKLAGYYRGRINGSGSNNTNSYYGGYFIGGKSDFLSDPSYAYVGLKFDSNNSGTGGGTNYKIIGNGSVSTLVDDNEGNKRVLFAPEAPEILFEDYGVGQLKNGSVYIKIDPLFSKSIHVSDKYPLKVFIQLEGECKGVYVTDKTSKGFLVKELNGGVSNTSFSYHLVANRADDIASDGSVSSKHVGLRFPYGPDAMEIPELKVSQLQVAKQKSVVQKILQKNEIIENGNVKSIQQSSSSQSPSIQQHTDEASGNTSVKDNSIIQKAD